MCSLVFAQPLRQIEGLMASLFALMGVDLPVPDHMTLSRRRGPLHISRKWRDDAADMHGAPMPAGLAHQDDPRA
ncbi:transposase [Brucella sp. LJL56]